MRPALPAPGVASDRTTGSLARLRPLLYALRRRIRCVETTESNVE
jgi:hypothetical protein